MEIDTGNNQPIYQKPYTLALKHAEWVKRELNKLEEARLVAGTTSDHEVKLLLTVSFLNDALGLEL